MSSTTSLPKVPIVNASIRIWVFLWLIAIVSGAGCNARFGGGIQGSGVLKTEQRPVVAFSRIDVGGSAKLDWQPAEEPSLEVTVEDNLLPLLVTEVVGDTLKISFNTNVSPTKDVVVKVASPRLDGLSGSGATQSTLKDVKSDEFKLGLEGASRCTIAGRVESLSVECSGACTLQGSHLDAGASTVDTNGACTVELRAKDLQSVRAAGASKVTVNQVDADVLKIELTGSSNCTLSGQVNKLDIQTAGAAALHGAELKAQAVQVDLSGASQVDVEAVKTIAGSAEGSARVRYRGDPATKAVRASGSASMARK